MTPRELIKLIMETPCDLDMDIYRYGYLYLCTKNNWEIDQVYSKGEALNSNLILDIRKIQ